MSFVVKQNTPLSSVFLVAGRTGFEYHPLNRGVRPNKNAPTPWAGTRFVSGGEDRIRTCDRGFRPGNRLAGGPIRPLWHLPKYFYVVATSVALTTASDGGGSGIRTHVGVTQTCFQDMRLQPLGHPSTSPLHFSGRRRFYHNIGFRHSIPGLFYVLLIVLCYTLSFLGTSRIHTFKQETL
jgi:hypothetical protein